MASEVLGALKIGKCLQRDMCPGAGTVSPCAPTDVCFAHAIADAGSRNLGALGFFNDFNIFYHTSSF